MFGYDFGDVMWVLISWSYAVFLMCTIIYDYSPLLIDKMF